MTPRKFVEAVQRHITVEEFDLMCILAAAGAMGSDKVNTERWYAPSGAG